MKKDHLVFPLTVQDLIYLKERRETHKTYHLQRGLFIVIVAFKDQIDLLRKSKSIAHAIQAGFSFINVPITEELLEEINKAEPGDDVWVIGYDDGLSVSLVNERVYNAMKEKKED